MPETILYEKTGIDNHVAIITLNRPEASNAINRQLRRELQEVINHFDHDDDEAWVAVVTGAGRNFCAGRDLKERASDNAEGVQARAENSMSPNRPHMWTRPNKPLVAAVNGAAAAGGWAIAQMCDVAPGRRQCPAGYHGNQVEFDAAFCGGAHQDDWHCQRAGTGDDCRAAAGAAGSGDGVSQSGGAGRRAPAGSHQNGGEHRAERSAGGSYIKELAYSSLDKSIAEISAQTYVAYDYILTTEDSKEGPRAFAEKRRPNWQLK